MKKPPLIPVILVLFFVTLMSFMGFWQLSRAKQKQQLLELLDAKNITQISNPEQIKSLPRYANIEMRGSFLNQPQLVLDNQIHDGVRGYHIFTPFQLENSDFFLMINRGWIAQNDFSNAALAIDDELRTISGQLNTSPQVGFQLGEIELQDSNIQMITYYENQKVSEFLHQQLCQSLNCLVSPKIVWLNPNDMAGFKRDWKPIIMMPEKHIGYAVQWFLMVIVLIAIFIFWLKKTNK
jgi:surfeit locus 1 family protein